MAKSIFNWLVKRKVSGADWCDSAWILLVIVGGSFLLAGLAFLAWGEFSSGCKYALGGLGLWALVRPAFFLAQRVEAAAKELESSYISPCSTQPDNTSH